MRPTLFQRGAHLDEKDILPPELECPLCSFDGDRSPFFRLQSDPEVSLLACPRCRGFSASRLPTVDALRAYYSRYYDSVPHSESVTFHEPRRFAKNILRKMKPQPGGRLKILDFGGGGGDLSLATAQMLLKDGASHVQVILVDYNSGLARNNLPDISLECHQRLDSTDAENCDLVFASGILEHIPHPQNDLTQLLASLRSGGLFYARTPAVAPLFHTLQRIGIHFDFLFPAHVHDMGEAYWSTILSLMPSEFRDYSVVCSQPSIVETTLRKDMLRSIAAHVMKFPWHILGSRYQFVGGWEVFIQRPGA